MGTRGTCPPPPRKCCEVLLYCKCCLKYAVDEVFMHFKKMSSASGGFAPRSPPELCPWTPLEDFPLIAYPKSCGRPCLLLAWCSVSGHWQTVLHGGVEKCKKLPSIFDPKLPLRRSDFKTKQQIGNLKMH